MISQINVSKRSARERPLPSFRPVPLAFCSVPLAFFSAPGLPLRVKTQSLGGAVSVDSVSVACVFPEEEKAAQEPYFQQSSFASKQLSAVSILNLWPTKHQAFLSACKRSPWGELSVLMASALPAFAQKKKTLGSENHEPPCSACVPCQ